MKLKEVGWNDWSDWGECSATCGEGTRMRKRTCNNILNKVLCVGDDTQVEKCNQELCKGFKINSYACYFL